MDHQLLMNMIGSLPAMVLALDDDDVITAAFGDHWRHVNESVSALVGKKFNSLKASPFRMRHIQTCRQNNEALTVVTPCSGLQFECTYATTVAPERMVICYARDKTSEMRNDLDMILTNIELAALTHVRSLQELATAVAHEVNNPLTIIAGNVWAIKMKIESGGVSVENTTASFDSISNNIRRITTLVKSLRDIANDVEMGVANLISLKDLSQKSLAQVGKDINCDGIHISIDSDTNHDEVMVSEVMIIAALEQVIINAIFAVRDLSEKWIKIQISEFSDHFTLSVTDSGAGIPQDLQHKIMQPFFTTREVGQGSGIGLNLTNRNVSANGGTFYLDKDAKNTRFVLRFPKP